MRLRHELADSWGRSVADLEETLDADEWTRWRAYRQLFPKDEETTQVLIAVLISYVHNYLRDKDSEPKSPADFLPHLGTRKATLDEVLSGAIRIDPRLRARLDGAE